MADATFCVMCGKSHVMGTACDPIWLDWVQNRRKEIAAGVPWQEATPMPGPQEDPVKSFTLAELATGFGISKDTLIERIADILQGGK